MPTAERYALYRAEWKTIWASKRATAFLNRERAPGETTAAVIDRLLAELRARRRSAGPAGDGRRGRGREQPAARAGARSR